MQSEKEKKQIFILYYCDEHKTTPMKVACVTTSALKLKKTIERLIRTGEMTYTNGEEISVTKQINMLSSDWKVLDRNQINTKLKFGFYDYAYDGEII